MTDEEVEGFVQDNRRRIEFLAERFGIETDEAIQRARVIWWTFWLEGRAAKSPRSYVMASIRNNLHNEWKRREVYSPIRFSLQDRVRLPDGELAEMWRSLPAREKSPADFVSELSMGVRVEEESTWPSCR